MCTTRLAWKFFLSDKRSSLLLVTTSGDKKSLCNVDQAILTAKEGSVQLTSLHRPDKHCYYVWIKKTFLNILRKMSLLNEEVNCTEPSPSISIPCSDLWLPGEREGICTVDQTWRFWGNGLGHRVTCPKDLEKNEHHFRNHIKHKNQCQRQLKWHTFELAANVSTPWASPRQIETTLFVVALP